MGRKKGSKNKPKETVETTETQHHSEQKPVGVEAPTPPKPKGVVLIALGNPQYGRMAANLAASIRNNDKDTPIHLIYSGDALNHLTIPHRNLFTSFAECPEECYTKNGKHVYLKAKTCIYDLTPFETTIFLDVDLVTFPNKKFSDLFEELKDIDFTFQNRGFKDLSGENLDKNFSLWCDINEVKEKYQTTGKFYHLASEFMYFKKNEENKKFFDLTKEIFDNPKVKATEFGEDIPDELAFDIAACVMGKYPHKDNFVVVYWGLIDGNIAWKDLLNKFWGYSIGGNVIPDSILQRYNQLALIPVQKLNIPFHYRAYNKKQWNKQRQSR